MVRLLRVNKNGPVHEVSEWEADVLLEGDLESRGYPVTLMRPLQCAFGCLLSFAILVCAEPDSAGPVPEVLARLVARSDGHGGGVVRISGPGGVLCEGAAGFVAGPGSARMTPDTPFEIASITKAVTAATILRLVEQGKLRLDSNLGEVLPAGTLRGFKADITVRQLLSHTSGLGDYWTDGSRDRQGNTAFIRAFNAAADRSWQPDEILSYAREIPAGRPGAHFQYSDTNYVLLGLIIERAAGRTLHRVFREEIFEPLGMKSTWLTYREKQRGAAPSHRYEGDEDLHAVPRQSADWAGGGLVSTTRDLERFLRGLASGALFHQTETLALMRESVPVGEADISYGLGLYRVKLEGGKGEIWGHDGHGNSFAYYWPQRDITFTGTLNQTENDWWPLVEIFLEGGKPETVVEESGKSFEASLSAGWDSLYMDRGVNALRDKGYGSGIAWTALEATWGVTETDFLTVNAWQCFATQGTAYREFDLSLNYTRLIGNLALSAGYTFNYGVSDGNFFSHELNVSAASDFSMGSFTLTPSLTYFYTLGPDADDGSGFVQAGSSYLLLRVDGHLPLYRGIASLAPWTAFGVNFDYNTRGEDARPFVGANNIEFGLAVPVKINRIITVSAYGAYSAAFTDLNNTAPNTFWGGASVTFSF